MIKFVRKAAMMMCLVLCAGALFACSKVVDEETTAPVEIATEGSDQIAQTDTDEETVEGASEATGSTGGNSEAGETFKESEADKTKNTSEETEEPSEETTAHKIETETGSVEVGVSDGKLTFVDAHENIYTVDVHEDWPMNDYDLSAFSMKAYTTPKDLRMTYDSDEYDFRLGIDVFGEHGGIDWWAVEYVGYDFAIMRAGYRGYRYPNLVLDDRVIENIEGALKYGLDVGVYFFSQAINEEEAAEEARFVIEALEEHGFGPDDLKMGIIFDPESILNDEARTDDVTGEQFTANAIAFCETVKEAGYKPMVYSNMVWEAEKLDLGKLSEYPIWYADYNDLPQTPYAYEIWQYGHAMAAGVAAQVDVNIQLVPKNEQK